MSILKKILLVLVTLIILSGIIWVGLSIYVNFFRQPEGALPDMPDSSKAAYIVLIKNTGNLLLTDEYKKQGDIYILQGYWELVEGKWRFRKTELKLNEGIFGKIEIERRE